MKTIQTKIELAIYGYNTTEFMPIFYDGQLENKGQFIAYKVKKAVRRFL